MAILTLALVVAGSVILITVGAGATDTAQDESQFKTPPGPPGTPTPTAPVPAAAASLASLDEALASGLGIEAGLADALGIGAAKMPAAGKFPEGHDPSLKYEK